MTDYDFVAIGDIVTDAFIRLKDAATHCNVKNDTCELCVRFGDKVPYESVTVVPAVGNSPNAAVATARLGLQTALVTNLGDDQTGRDCLSQLATENISPEFIAIHPSRKTNYHYVLWYESDRTILIKHEEYPVHLPEIRSPKWLYFSSVGRYADKLHDLLADYLEACPKVKLTFQPGTFQIKLGRERLARIYARTEVLVCNVREAQQILNTEESELKKLLQALHTLGPKIALITDGPRGAYASDAKQAWFMPPYPDPKPPLDRTGAGDAFASTFSAAMLLGQSLQTALVWAPINSMAVVQKVGAQEGLLNREQLEKYLAQAPEDYQPTALA